MIVKVFGIYDLKAKMFSVPFFMPTVPMATRAFTDMVNNPETMAHKHPSDFVLYELGEFDDDTGVLRPHEQHLHLGIAAQYKEQVPDLSNARASTVSELRKAFEVQNGVVKEER